MPKRNVSIQHIEISQMRVATEPASEGHNITPPHRNALFVKEENIRGNNIWEID